MAPVELGRRRFQPDQAGEPLDTGGFHLVALPSSVRYARHQVSALLSAWGLADRADDVALVTSEYVTNAVAATGPERVPEGYAALYDGTPPLFGVRLSRSVTHLVLEVADVSAAPPVPRRAADLDEDGRGLALVSALADHVGCYPVGTGKVVWAAWAVRGGGGA